MLASGRPQPASGRPLRSQGGGTYGRMYVRMEVQIPPVFYRTSSPPVPSGAAAQKATHIHEDDENSISKTGGHV